MASGQQRVVINNGERAISGDHNRLQNLAARERNEIFRALLQASWSDAAPGVSVRDEGAGAASPMAAVVLDGLEALVDTPGHVMISPGTLAGWTGTPADADSSGFLVVDSDGINYLSDQMVIGVNAGGSARCDVIEVRFDVDTVSTYENRDVYDPGTSTFVPASIPKMVRSQLAFRVRTGTPGVAPGTAAGWLPLALAIVQPGATVAQVDFYDVRPLWRERGGNNSFEAVLNGATKIAFRSDHAVVAATSGPTLPQAYFGGYVDAEFAGADIRGRLYRNTPINQGDLAQWGLTTANGVGGDSQGINLVAATAVRGAGAVVSAHDEVYLCACFPTLGSAFGTVPRCVRYSQSAANNQSATPARRKPQGPNGLMMWVSMIQEDAAFNDTSTVLTCVAPGIDGCLGTVNCVPIALANVDRSGTNVLLTKTGLVVGGKALQGLAQAANQLMLIADMTGALDTTVAATPEHPDGGAGVAVANAVFEDDSAKVADRIDVNIGMLSVTLYAAGAAGAAGYHVKITEDAYGTPLVHTLSQWFASEADASAMFDAQLQRSFVLARTGTVKIEIFAYNALGTQITISNSSHYGWDGVWGTYRRYRP